MSSVMHPVGPEPPRTYWLRRLAVVAAAIVVIAIIVWLWPSGGSAPVAAPTASTEASASSSPSPSASPSDSASPSPSSSGETQTCATRDLELAVQVEPAAPTVGSQVVFVMTIANVGDQPCNQDVGAAVTSFTVSSGGYRVWSSDDCNPGGNNQVETIPPGQAYAVQATWPTIVTTPGCPSTDVAAQAGSYDVVGADGDLSSAPVRFALSPAG